MFVDVLLMQIRPTMTTRAECDQIFQKMGLLAMFETLERLPMMNVRSPHIDEFPAFPAFTTLLSQDGVSQDVPFRSIDRDIFRSR
jgi:hypothetical protein